MAELKPKWMATIKKIKNKKKNSAFPFLVSHVKETGCAFWEGNTVFNGHRRTETAVTLFSGRMGKLVIH